jgi:Asp-tRNA(Asn)/Glu-tRNA(Gln) amidotransferase A subunit family amidase
MMSGDDLIERPAVEIAAGIRSGAWRSEEVVAAFLARIKAEEPRIEAWAHCDPDYAIDQARRADAWRDAGRPIGALHGVPVGVKDIIDTGDMPTEHGSPVFAGNRPPADAAAVTRLREAGAIILGKTVTTELAVYTPNKTRNPHDPERTPGGSSSGSAAAVAAHMVPLALGTQTNGSVVRPAAFCGVYGLKPSFGMISRKGVLSQSPPLDTVGMFANGIPDLALAADVLSAYDADDRWMYPRSRGSHYQVATSAPPVAPLLAFVKSPFWDRGSAGMQAAFGNLREALGAACEEIALPPAFASAERWHRQILTADLARHFGPIAARSGEALSAQLRGLIADGTRVSAVDYNNAVDQGHRLYAQLADVFARYAAILTPAAPGPAPKGLAATGDPIFATLWTYLGTPAVSLPLLTVDGMPLGVQLVGARRDDARLLRTAQWLVDKLAENRGATVPGKLPA